MPIIRNSSATLLMGDTGSGKSALIATLAKWVWDKHKKVTLLYTSDGGGWNSNVEAAIDAGTIWPWKMPTRKEPFETCAKASEGWWPKKWDPMTGETAPQCELVQPLKQEYHLLCPDRHLVKRGANQRAFPGVMRCPTCEKQVSLQTGTVERITIASPGFKNVGARAYDGITSMQAWIMRNMAHRRALGEIVGEKDNLGGSIISGDRHFGANNRSHYGFAQIQAEEWILNSVAIPGLVVPPVWTALEERATDVQSRLPIYGPKIAGSARTADVPSWVGNCLGTQIVYDEDGRRRWRLNLTEYRDSDNIPHLCKTRAAPGTGMPDFLQDPHGVDFDQFNLGYFFELLDASTEKAISQYREGRDYLPGLPSGELSDDDGDGTPSSTTQPIQRAQRMMRPRPPSLVPGKTLR